MATRPRCVGANGERWESRRGGFVGSRDEWSVYEDLHMVVTAIEKDGLFKELGMLAVGIPAD